MITTRGNAIQSSTGVCMKRVLTQAGTVLLPTDVTSLSASVYNADTGQLSATLAGGATTIYGSLQTDARWTEDTTGYNVAIVVPGTAWPSAGDYRVELVIVPVVGTQFKLLWDVQVQKTYGA